MHLTPHLTRTCTHPHTPHTHTAAAADQSSGSLTTTPSVQPSTDGLLPTPSHPTQPSHPTHPTQFDSEAHMKMFQMQQDMMAANPELLNYQAALMAQQNPMIMQYLWLQQQQVGVKLLNASVVALC